MYTQKHCVPTNNYFYLYHRLRCLGTGQLELGPVHYWFMKEISVLNSKQVYGTELLFPSIFYCVRDRDIVDGVYCSSRYFVCTFHQVDKST